MRGLFTFAALACAASTASASHTTFMKADFQVFDGTNWVEQVTVNPGESVNCRIVISFDLAAGNAVSLGGVNFTQIDVASTAAGDSTTGFTGLIFPTQQVFGLVGAGTATAKIDRTNSMSPTAPIQLLQLPTDNGGSADNPIVALQFQYATDALTSALRDIVFGLNAADEFSLAVIFVTPGGTNVPVPLSGRAFDGSTIHVAPSPGALALIGVGGGLRRRRR